MFNFLKIFNPAPHVARLSQDKIDPHYKKLRWQVFMGVFVGYTGYYLLRNNFSLAIPHLEQEGFTKTQLGVVFSALPLAYGISKFFMGTVSDRSNPRFFIATGLIISAIINLCLGTHLILGSLSMMMVLMFINGWVQGMGYPASSRVMVHWFSEKERGTLMSIWSSAQNVGGGLIGPLAIFGIGLFSTWHSVFYFPAIIALIIAAFTLFTVRDTPQSEGLPPIEEYKNEYPAEEKEDHVDLEKELTTKEILFKYVLVNKYLWYISFANVFVYLVRYGVINWAPSYLTEVKGFSHSSSSWAYFLYEYAAIPGTILCGWISDRFFRGRRAPICIIYMLAVAAAVTCYWLNPVGHDLYDDIALVAIGFLIYGPVVMIGIYALDLVPKKAAGTAAGLTGFFGYVGGTTIANIGIGAIVDHYGWNGGFITLIASCFLAIFFLSLTWNRGGAVSAAEYK